MYTLSKHVVQMDMNLDLRSSENLPRKHVSGNKENFIKHDY